MSLHEIDVSLIGLVSAVFYTLGLLLSLMALWRSRTPQGATAWIVGLLSFPFVFVPLFLFFGRNKFFGYVKRRKDFDSRAEAHLPDFEALFNEEVKPSGDLLALKKIAGETFQIGFTKGNRVELLVDAQNTYSSMLREIEKAEDYILVQFYIVRNDKIGQKFANLLAKRAAEGVKVYFVYDAIGTRLPRNFLKTLKASKVDIRRFDSTKAWKSRFQINFRNHRKLLVVDGRVAFVGGLNLGDDYLGKWKEIGKWRDTHVRIEGPAATASQISFLKDWLWITDQLLTLNWKVKSYEDNVPALILHTGPADNAEACLAAHLALVGAAKKRIWIANPYFLPPEALLNALALARLRGVEVRVLIPSFSDNRLVQWASVVYQEKLLLRGIKFFKFTDGFLHQKVLLIDDEISVIGSINLDSRSLFINFEVMAILYDKNFAKQVEAMLELDWANSKELFLEELAQQSFFKQVLARAAGLLSPML